MPTKTKEKSKKTKSRTGVGGRPQKRRKDPWEPLTKAILRRISARCPELKKPAGKLSKEWKRICEAKRDDISLDDLNIMKRLSTAMRGQPVSKETALESAIRLEMKLLLNPGKYPSKTKTKIKDNLLAWLFMNPIISIKVNGRKVEVITPFTRLDSKEGEPTDHDETIVINGFKMEPKDKSRDLVLVKYKSACMGEVAHAATKALGIEVTARNVETVF